MDSNRGRIRPQFLIPKLPAPVEEDLSKGILESIDMDSYRAEVRSTMSIALEDEDGEEEGRRDCKNVGIIEGETEQVQCLCSQDFKPLFDHIRCLSFSIADGIIPSTRPGEHTLVTDKND